MANQSGQTNLVITNLDVRLANMFKAAIEITGQDRATIFKTIIKPWLDEVLRELTLSSSNPRAIDAIEMGLEEIYGTS